MKLLFTLLFLVSTASPAGWPYPYHVNGKKYIEYGFDLPTPRYVAANIVSMETQPFDGLVVAAGNSLVFLFNPADWTRGIDNASLSRVHWHKFTTNFLDLHSNDSSGMDYFNDIQWTQIAANVHALSLAAKNNGFRGIFWDVEPYSALSPWKVVDNQGTHSLAALQHEVFLRGAQIMQAAQSAYPNITIYMDYMQTSASDTKQPYALLANFVNGMLSVIGPQVILVNGQEWIYWSGDTKYWFSAYDQSKTILRNQFVNADYYTVWDAQVGVGRATYDAAVLKSGLTESQQIQKVQHNVYMGMVTTDEINVGYFEQMNWWGNTAADQPVGNNITASPPSWFTSAIVTARNLFASGTRLGFDWVGGTIDGGGGLPNTSVTVNLMQSGSVITAKASATSSKINRMEVWVNMVLKATSATHSASYDLAALGPGSYDVVARSYSAAEASGTSNLITIGAVHPPTRLRSRER